MTNVADFLDKERGWKSRGEIGSIESMDSV